MGKNDRKNGDKSAAKGKTAEKDAGGSKSEGAQSIINVRHILCEKHAKKEEVLAKLRDWVKFDEVARTIPRTRRGGVN
ncbi:hypothetical protein E4U13_004360 [Claviceps humidiphila]|uniref:Uncharacterized protein n=1 Tax=Claviceps humidiphila TaxID=1294629 RepID=A0A9P7PYC6_9HYPO|nr:hypothetical protein E4U13_004360 [Claviceps humidiphila]